MSALLPEPRPDVGVGVSLWLRPADGVGERLDALIRGLAGRFGTEPFPAHLTLLAGLRGREGEVLRRASELGRTVAPVRLRAFRVEARDEFFRCLSLRVEETLALLTLHAQARIAFARSEPSAYEPHLSLVYGRLPPAARATLERELRSQVPLPFETAALEVWRTRGPAAEWQRLAAHPLRPESP